MDNTWFVLATWLALALAASMISIRLGLSVALVETFVGIFAGNFLGLHSTAWIDFLASFGSVLLTFLAAAEVDPASFRRQLKPSLAIGIVSFLGPFLLALAVAHFAAGWDLRAAEIAGVTLSETSVAVVYAVMIETGLNETALGKLILAACFVTNLGTILMLGLLFSQLNPWILVFGAVTAVLLWVLPRLTRWVIANWGGRVAEPEVKFVFLILAFLGGLSTVANSEAVLPAYLVGLAIAGVFLHDKVLVHRMRAIAFTLLTPFYFIRAGMYVSLPAMLAGFGLVAGLLAVKIGAKFIGVWSVTRLLRMPMREGTYTTLLMSTGLTFGNIAALFGLTHQIIDQTQYSILLAVVIGSAVVPTLIAQGFFLPARSTSGEVEKTLVSID